MRQTNQLVLNQVQAPQKQKRIKEGEVTDFTRLKLILVSLGVHASKITEHSHLEKELKLSRYERDLFFEMAESYLKTPIFFSESIPNIYELLERVSYARKIGL